MKILVSLITFTLVLIASIPSLSNEAGHRNNNLFPPKQPNKTLSTPPKSTSLIEPAFMSKISGNEVTLKWNSVEGVDTYHVQVATDPVYKWLVTEDKLYKGTSFQLKGLEAGKHYYWRVSAVKPENMATFMKSEFSRSMFETTEK